MLKLKIPHNAIGGVGFYNAQSQIPLSTAWDTFQWRNGFDTIDEFRTAIQYYRRDKERNPIIGCIALTNPIFFKREDWIAVPEDWSTNIVQGKTYTTNNAIGLALWQRVESLLKHYLDETPEINTLPSVADDRPAYGNPVLRKVRIGQGAFRLSVIDAYQKRCAITGEKTLPVLEAAHIRPFAEAGPNRVTNGLLLRSDMHKLFDNGYITITPDYRIEISQRIKEEFNNGREYYQYHGKSMLVLPAAEINQPSKLFLDYHNQTIFRP
ncbi:HNH endonuclease [Spirosoma sp. KUDC1026]|uniref:HNH endonuclease n=1 Tax=Spirosoma sp. KUDC1026 TaxID=2745947 RepID=UPI00159B9A5F|nr:HNH endonuclease [Spirosoma sp. KUDC1026]QKZ12192.1 HNH endonuclease [Spirosoma sp. KUDC1026]